MSDQTTSEIPKATRRLAEFAVNTKYEDLPSTLIDRLRTDALDGVAVGIYGSTLPWITLATEYWEEIGGKPEATVWGRKSKLPVIMATLANSHAQNAFEYDDTYNWRGLGCHTGNNVIPASIAISEMLGGVPGREFITAHAIGMEIGIRIRLGFKEKRLGHNYTAITSTFGAAAAAGRLLGLNVDQMNWALGSAGSYVGGYLTVPASSMVKRMVNGRAAQGGVMGALLAKRNFTGIENFLEAERGGYYGVTAIEADWEALLGGLGETWNCANVFTKRYPICTSIIGPAEAVSQVVRDEDFSVDEVEKIKVYTTSAVQPLICGALPETISAAQLNLAFGVATAMVTGKIDPRDVNMEKAKSSVIDNLMRRVEPIADAEYDARRKDGAPDRYPTRVEVILKDGRMLKSKFVPEPSTMTPAEVESKANDAMEDIIGKDSTQQIIEFFRGIDKLDTVNGLFGLLKAN
ncbi:MAG: MmgE/PrpD family protein [Desulfobacteraceae bacterium]|nr:MmgE/PrpD family protein [Desulfobacteraceae bacterium]